MPRVQSKVTGDAEFAGLFAELQSLHLKQPDKVPPGWKTMADWGKAWDRCRVDAHRFVLAGMRAGLWEWKKFRIKTEGGRVYAVPHYRRKTNAKAA